MTKSLKPLYRKVNTKARGVRHGLGVDFKKIRNKKRESAERIKGSMHRNIERGLDYTPLYQFLLSKVGNDWDTIFSEAIARLDKKEPIFRIVALTESDKRDYVRIGESSYFSGLYVDSEKKLQFVNAQLRAKDLIPTCSCCTHTLNGKEFGAE